MVAYLQGHDTQYPGLFILYNLRSLSFGGLGVPVVLVVNRTKAARHSASYHYSLH